MSMIVKLLRVPAAQLETYKTDSKLLTDRIYGDTENDDAMLNIDKSWAGILFLLTGQALEENNHPLMKVFFSGQHVDEAADLGYGPAEYLLPSEVKELSAALSIETVETLTEKFDAARMSELGIYPDIWQEEGALYYLLAFFMEIESFYSVAAVQDEAIITGLI